jgi:hypothetical protein
MARRRPTWEVSFERIAARNASGVHKAGGKAGARVRELFIIHP